jgi:glycosyltransferase involved in cell wall biosynthesis
MKILIATDSFLPRWDGIASFLNVVIPRFKDKHRILVVGPDYGSFEGYEGVDIARFPTWKKRLGDYRPPKPKYGVIKEKVRQVDVVWTQTLGPIGMMTILAAHHQKKPVIAYIHSIEWELFVRSVDLREPFRFIMLKLIRNITRFFYNKCDLLIVPTEEVGDILTQAGISTQKKVIGLGVDTKRFIPADNKAEAKKRLGIDPKMTIIGFVGRLGKEKDIATLYRAFMRLRNRHDSLMLMLVGQDIGGMTEHYEGKERIMLVGTTNNVIPYLQAMDIYVLPSLTETTSLSTLEAMATGIPVISTPVGFVKFYLKNKENGYFFPKKNNYLLSRRIRELVDNKELRRKMGQKARLTVETGFSWEKTINDIDEVLTAFTILSD